MQKIGIIGGIGPESTIEYYRSFLATHRRSNPSGEQLPIVINSVDVRKILSMIAEMDYESAVQYLLTEIEVLHRAGASVGLIAANTPHVVFGELSKLSPLPLVSIVEATCSRAKDLKLKRLGLMGTKFTMEGSFYSAEFSKHEIEVVAPAQGDLDYIHRIYVDELLNNQFRQETRDRVLEICGRMRLENEIDGVVLGGTELPLLLQCDSWDRIPLLNTTQIHVEAVLRVV